MFSHIAFFLLGLIFLIGGAYFLVSGAASIALIIGIPPLVVGLTIVSFGTSAPEIAVCTLAAIRQEGALVVGNVVGSNIFNVLLTLGLLATISPLVVRRRLLQWDVPILVGVSLLVWLFALFGTITRLQGIILFLGIIGYILWEIKTLKKEEKQETRVPRKPQKIWRPICFTLIGMVALALGSDWLVTSSSDLADALGVSELFIGLTIVAIGTSLPEIATSLIALFKKEKDIAIGNVVGSNIFNLLAVLGISALFAPKGIKVPASAISFDFPVMAAVALATFPIFVTGHKVSRSEGILFLFYYCAYLTLLCLRATHHTLLPLFTSAMLFFVVPLTLITLIISLYRHFSKK